MTTLFMRSIKYFLVSFLFLIILGTLSFPLFVGAQTTSTTSTSNLHLVFEPPCVKIGISSIDSCDPITDIQTYIKRLYQFAVGISGIVAVGMIVYGAILIIIKSENVVAKSEGKQIIQDALWGVLLLFASYLLLNTINPELVKLKEPSTGNIINMKQQGVLNQLSSSTCALSTNIEGVSNAQIYGTVPEVSNVCTYRHLFDKDGMVINPVGEAGNYYGLIGDVIPPNSVLWVYPYYIKSVGVSSARCLVYAYRTQFQKAANQQLGDIAEKTTMTDLDNDVTPCILPKLPSGTTPTSTSAATTTLNITQFSGWDEARGGMASAFASTTQNLTGSKGISLSYYSTNGDCEPKTKTSAYGIMDDTKKGLYPYVCHDGCKASGTTCDNTSGKILSSNLLALLDAMQFDFEKKTQFRTNKTLPRFTVTSLTGGDHTGNNSNHYKGISADVVASSKEETETLLLYIKDKGISAWCEYFENNKFVRVSGTSCGDYGKVSGTSYTALHIHIDYP